MKQNNKVRSIHFVGIKGVGMTPLAIMAKEAGCRVSGSDVDEQFITDESLNNAGISVLKGFAKEHITDQNLVIATGAHGGYSNIEVLTAKEKNIPVLSHGEAVGVFMQGDILGRTFTGVSVAGTHGKTTTTAMVATVLKESNMDPSYIIGTSSVPTLGASGHFGKGSYFIAEADEYVTEPTSDKTPRFLWHHPKFAIITNIEFDHPDVYADITAVRSAFIKFTKNIPPEGVLIAYGDDPQVTLLLKEYRGNVITYGRSPLSDYILQRFYTSEKQTFFSVNQRGASLGEFQLSVPGEHNCLNALAVIAFCLEIGMSVDYIKTGLQQFAGSKRRFEYVGTLTTGALFYDDYAHHPTEIQKTLASFKEKFPHKKIVCIFQPHTYSRTKQLFVEFSQSFSDADTAILTNIFASAREAKDETVSSEKLVTNIKQLQGKAIFLPEKQDVVKYLDQKRFGEDTVIVTMGAGDVYQIAKSLDFKKEHAHPTKGF